MVLRVALRWIARGALLAVVSAVGLAGWALAADTKPPSAPGNFQATVADGSAKITLSWVASVDESGVKSYELDRSLDEQTWSTLSDTIAGTATTYDDASAGFGVHYYYRLMAVDLAGNASAWSTTDLETSSFQASAAGSSDNNTFVSADNVATVQVPKDAVADGKSFGCVISNSFSSTKQLGSSDQPLVVGPYLLSCKTIAGDPVVTLAKPVLWSFDLHGKLKKLGNPQPYLADSDGNLMPVKSFRYDAKTETLKALTAETDPLVVTAQKPQGFFSVNLMIVFMVVAALVWGIILIMINRRKKNDREKYFRNKYYDL